jgi:hypothetical protein
VGPRAGLGTKATGKKYFASVGYRISIARSSNPQPDTILTETPRLQGSEIRDSDFVTSDKRQKVPSQLAIANQPTVLTSSHRQIMSCNTLLTTVT